ncbi:MAG: tetratricopeptide repeat protein [Acidobacteriota bacterium]
MRRFAIAACLTLALGPLVACTSSEDMALLQREITDVQRSVDNLQTETVDKSDLRAMQSKMQEMTDKTMRSNADLVLEVQQLQEQIEALTASLELTTLRLQEISQELAAAGARDTSGYAIPPVTAAPADEGGEGGEPPPGGGAAAGGPAASTTPEALYRSAYEDYMRGNYDLAADGFAEYLRRYPDTELSDNALYWIALDTFSKVLEDYPSSDKAAAAQLKIGLLYLKLDDQGQAVVNLQYVVYEHPGTREADLAREQLKSLGMTIR